MDSLKGLLRSWDIIVSSIVFFQDKKVRFWDTRMSSTEPVSEVGLTSKVTSLDLARSGQMLLCCLRDDTLRTIDLRSVFFTIFNSIGFPSFRL